jgi:hypothetical protein
VSRTAYAIERPLTPDELLELWRVIDQQPRRRASSPSAILIIGRCVAAVMMATIVLTIGPFLRATGA